MASIDKFEVLIKNGIYFLGRENGAQMNNKQTYKAPRQDAKFMGQIGSFENVTEIFLQAKSDAIPPPMLKEIYAKPFGNLSCG